MVTSISEFTEEEACKDTHMIINRMNCAQLTKTMLGKFACQSDEKVKNYCCRSCRGEPCVKNEI